MDNTAELLEKLKNLNDAELSDAIYRVARSLGANEKTAARISAERDKIRRKLESADGSDLKKTMSRLNKSQLERVFSALDERTGGGNGSK